MILVKGQHLKVRFPCNLAAHLFFYESCYYSGLLILGVNAVNLCDRINRAHCMVETMIQATYSFVEEGIMWGQV